MISYREMTPQQREEYAKKSIEESNKKDKKYEHLRRNYWANRNGPNGCVRTCELPFRGKNWLLNLN